MVGYMGMESALLVCFWSKSFCAKVKSLPSLFALFEIWLWPVNSIYRSRSRDAECKKAVFTDNKV